jgi:pyruvate/2-oxoglutarate dehydrogenase complex dihydrolipoamide acyltransferase (E2) component
VRAFRSDLRMIGTLELLKSLTAARASGIVSFETQPEGGVLLEDGLIVAASWGQLSGASALARLLVLTSGPFRVGAQLRQVQPDDPRAPQTLLLEALHIVTRERLAAPAPAPAQAAAPAPAAEPSLVPTGAATRSPAPTPAAKSDDTERAAALARLLARLTSTNGAHGTGTSAGRTVQEGSPSQDGSDAAPVADSAVAEPTQAQSAVASSERPPTISRIMRAEAAASRQSARPLRSKSLWWMEVVRGLPHAADADVRAEESEVAPEMNPSSTPRSLAARIRSLLG